jgi:hypothetical protein
MPEAKEWCEILFDRTWRAVFSVFCLSALCLSAAAAKNPRIIPLQTEVDITASQFAKNPWSIPIKSTEGRTVYVLSLEPDVSYDRGNHPLQELDLVLRPPRSRDVRNLLAPIGDWHGIQSFMFSAWDFKEGVDKSVYGKTRVISVNGLRLVVRITVLKVATSQSGSQFQLDSLDLKIEVDNSPN